jgi:hypothetical protein
VPEQLEFIRRINDLPNLDEVQRTVFDASYLVMGLATFTSAHRSPPRSTRAIAW